MSVGGITTNVASGATGMPQSGAPANTAWNDAWARKFAEAGMAESDIAQLHITGAGGATAEQLQQSLDQTNAESNQYLAALQQRNPHEYKLLSESPWLGEILAMQTGQAEHSNRAALVTLAKLVADGTINAGALKSIAESTKQGKPDPSAATPLGMAKSMALSQFDPRYLAPMVIPGYNVLRIPAVYAFNHGDDPITKEHVALTGTGAIMTAAFLPGGLWAITNNVRNAGRVRAGTAFAQTAEGAQLLAHSGLTSLGGLRSYMPGSRENLIASGLSRIGALDTGLAALKRADSTSLATRLAENELSLIRNGNVGLRGGPAVEFQFGGMWIGTRGMVLRRHKELASAAFDGAQQIAKLDLRTTGPSSIAHLASVAVDHADGLLRDELYHRFGVVGTPTAEQLKLMRASIFGEASKHLIDSGHIKVGAVDHVQNWLRPGPVNDAVTAARNFEAGTPLAKHGMQRIPQWGRWGLGIAAVAGAAYLGIKAYVGHAKDQQQKLEDKHAAAVKAFLAQPLATQQQLLQQQSEQLLAASRQLNLSPQQLTQLANAREELQVIRGAFQRETAELDAKQQQQTQPQSTQQPAPQSAAGSTAPPSPGGFTAQGLGLG